MRHLETPQDEKQQELDGSDPEKTTNSQANGETLTDGNPEADEGAPSETPQDEKLALDERIPVDTTNLQTEGEAPMLDDPKPVDEEASETPEDGKFALDERVPVDTTNPQTEGEGTQQSQSPNRENLLPMLEEVEELLNKMEELEEANDELILKYFYADAMELILQENPESEMIPPHQIADVTIQLVSVLQDHQKVSDEFFQMLRKLDPE